MFPCCQNKCLQPGENASPPSTPPRGAEKLERQEEVDSEETKEEMSLEFVGGLEERD